MANSHHHSSLSVLIIATIVIFAFAAIELIGGWLANSLALWSDAVHMISDGIALLFAAIAAWIAKQPPSAKLSFGYGRAEVIAAVMSSVMLLVVVAGITTEAIHRLPSPSPIHGKLVML